MTHRPLLLLAALALALAAEFAVASLVSGARLATISAASKPSIASCSGQPHVDSAP